jgi:hypothetical protein
MTQHRLLALASLFAVTSLGAQERRSERSFSWDGAIPEGRWLYVRSLNGGIRVDRATGNQVEVRAEKRWRRGNPDDVRIVVQKTSGSDVVICALWNERTDCDENGYRMRGEGWRGGRRNDTSVEFTVRLPAGVKLATSTVNGDLEIAGVTSEVEVQSVNGSIVAASGGGPVRANTVNGSISVRMRDAGREDLEFETVNGTIEVWVPSDFNAEVDMRTVNGRVDSEFPMTISGRINPRHIRATIGNGGRRVKFSTVNGSIELRKL